VQRQHQAYRLSIKLRIGTSGGVCTLILAIGVEHVSTIESEPCRRA